MEKTISIQVTKSCGNCSACCSGRLTATVYGHEIFNGRPCAFLLEKKCSIYNQRPEDPCKKYLCAYLQLDWMPMWMRPDQCGVLISIFKTKNGTEYLQAVEYDRKMPAEVLSFLIQANRAKQPYSENIAYQIDGGTQVIGSEEFIKEIRINSVPTSLGG
jgi:hypothetical protein